MSAVYITHTEINYRRVVSWGWLLQLHHVLLVMTCTTEVNTGYDEDVMSGHSQFDDHAIYLFLLSSHFSLTSLFYGEPSEKEKSPSESSPSDSETKDVVGLTVFHQLLKATGKPFIAFSYPVEITINKHCFVLDAAYLSIRHLMCPKGLMKMLMYFLMKCTLFTFKVYIRIWSSCDLIFFCQCSVQ